LVFFEVVSGEREDVFDFDPAQGMSGTATNCLCCKASVPAKYIREYGESPGYGQQLLCVIVVNPYDTGKLYLADDSWVEGEAERQRNAEERARALEAELNVTTLDELIPPTGNAGLATGKSYLYGIRTFQQAYTPRQRCVLLEFVREIRGAHDAMMAEGLPPERGGGFGLPCSLVEQSHGQVE
jgi:putative DNA methylase